MKQALVRDPLLVDSVMSALPLAQRRWCGKARCECSSCANGLVSRDEWIAWFSRRKNDVCASCGDAVYRVGRDRRRHLACESCGTFWD